MSKNSHSEIKIALIGAAAGVIFTAIYDWIKQKPILSTFINLIKWIWNTVFEREVKIWQIIIGIIIIIAFRKIIKKQSTEIITENENENDWFGYTEDTFEGLKWKWKWQKGSFGKWHLSNLYPICEKCGTTMNLATYGFNSATCPRCNHQILSFKNPSDVEAVILDNIERKLY